MKVYICGNENGFYFAIKGIVENAGDSAKKTTIEPDPRHIIAEQENIEALIVLAESEDDIREKIALCRKFKSKNPEKEVMLIDYVGVPQTKNLAERGIHCFTKTNIDSERMKNILNEKTPRYKR